jgi:hypothetical protein
VQVVEHLGETLRLNRDDRPGRAIEGPGHPGPGSFVMRTRRWEDFLALGVTEIRDHAGSTTVDLARAQLATAPI